MPDDTTKMTIVPARKHRFYVSFQAVKAGQMVLGSIVIEAESEAIDSVEALQEIAVSIGRGMQADNVLILGVVPLRSALLEGIPSRPTTPLVLVGDRGRDVH